MFIGIGARAAMDTYIQGVHTSKITGIETSTFKVSYDDVPEPAVPNPPAEQTFWAESTSGASTQQITMDLRSGAWVAAIMNANANPGASVNTQAGFHSEFLEPPAPSKDNRRRRRHIDHGTPSIPDPARKQPPRHGSLASWAAPS